MRRRPELMQLEMGISTRRYLPASGTAGLERSLVRGKRRCPCPPPMITERTLLVLMACDWRPVSERPDSAVSVVCSVMCVPWGSYSWTTGGAQEEGTTGLRTTDH